jgi:hypothetical protein
VTLDQLLTDLNARIGSEPEIENANMTTWLNQGLLTFCNTADYHWLEKLKTASTVTSQEAYAMPSDCKRMLELKVDGTRYQYVRFERRNMFTTDQKTYSVLNNQIYLNPIPTTTTANNISMAYVMRPSKMVDGSDSPSDTDIAQLPEVYHEALVIYAFAVYNGYDEEHGEQESLMGRELRPVPGSFYWFVKTAKEEEQQRKRGQRGKMMSTNNYYGYSRPNQTAQVNTVLGN